MHPNLGTQTKDSQTRMTPDHALQLLKEGNERFVEKQGLDRDLMKQVHDTSTGQFPFAAILSCVDSRVSAELVFDQGVGDIFSARVAGNILNPDLCGSLEFACKVAGSKLLLVMGHTSCGAVKGAADSVDMGNLTGLLFKLKPALDKTSTEGERSSKNIEFVDAVALKNVELTLDKIRRDSEILHEMEEQGAIKMVGAMYDVHSGKVNFL